MLHCIALRWCCVVLHCVVDVVLHCVVCAVVLLVLLFCVCCVVCCVVLCCAVLCCAVLFVLCCVVCIDQHSQSLQKISSHLHVIESSSWMRGKTNTGLEQRDPSNRNHKPTQWINMAPDTEEKIRAPPTDVCINVFFCSSTFTKSCVLHEVTPGKHVIWIRTACHSEAGDILKL